MKKKPTTNKAKKFDEEMRVKQQMPKDKETRQIVSSLYKNRGIPTRRNGASKSRPVKRGK